MKPVAEKKITCSLESDGTVIEATGTLIEVQYTDDIVFWNFVLQATEDDCRRLGPQIREKRVGLKTSDGRSGWGFVTRVLASEGYHELAGVGQPNKQ